MRVNVKQDIYGIITLSSAQMVEELEEEEDPPKEEGENKEAENKEEEVEVKEGEEKEKKRKKLKKTFLEFSESRPLDWTKEEIDNFFELDTPIVSSAKLQICVMSLNRTFTT